MLQCSNHATDGHITAVELVDSHAHIDVAEFDSDRAEVIARAEHAGVRTQIVPAISYSGFDNLRRVCARWPGLHPAYGLHPMFVADHQPQHLTLLAEWVEREKPRAIGECGLDFYLHDTDADSQRLYFESQLQLAKDVSLPLILHARRALDQVTHALRRSGNVRGVVHSFSGSLQQAEHLWHLGFMIGIGGPITYPRASRLRSIVAQMPIDHLLLETDSPDQPLSGQGPIRNEPANLLEILNCVAELRGEDAATIAAATTRNARNLFGF